VRIGEDVVAMTGGTNRGESVGEEPRRPEQARFLVGGGRSAVVGGVGASRGSNGNVAWSLVEIEEDEWDE
jgi:hypothetical protein